MIHLFVVFRVPRGGWVPKVGVSSWTEDVRPVSEMEAGVNFRCAGEVLEQVVVHIPGRRPPGTRCFGGGAVTPSTHRWAGGSGC